MSKKWRYKNMCRGKYHFSYRVKVRMALEIGKYQLNSVTFKCADKDQAEKKKSEVEGILYRALNRETETFAIGDCHIRSEDLYGYKVKIKEPDKAPDANVIDDDEDDDD